MTDCVLIITCHILIVVICLLLAFVRNEIKNNNISQNNFIFYVNSKLSNIDIIPKILFK